MTARMVALSLLLSPGVHTFNFWTRIWEPALKIRVAVGAQVSGQNQRDTNNPHSSYVLGKVGLWSCRALEQLNVGPVPQWEMQPHPRPV